MEMPDKDRKLRLLEETRAFLRETGWLSERAPYARERILAATRLVEFDAGETVYLMGDPSDGVYGFASGGLQIQLPGDDGQVVAIHRTEPGFWVGESALFAEGERLISLIAGQSTVGLHIPQVVLLELVAATPSLYGDFFALSHRNLETALRLLGNMAVAGADRRLALRLLHYEEINAATGGWIALGQAELAELIAVSLPTLQRAMRRFVAAGAVEQGYGRVRVLDRQRLLAISVD